MPDMSGERSLAWEMHVALASRIAAVRLGPDEGLLEEALDSLHKVFDGAREALTKYPAPPSLTADSAHTVVVGLLNDGLRPFLVKWHPRLQAHAELRPRGVPTLAHEREWEQAAQLRAELADLQILLRDVAERLATLAGAGSLLAGVR